MPAISVTPTRTAAWADTYVRKWRARDYQKPVLTRASLIDAARRGDWTKLPEMIAYVTSKDRDEIFAASLIRLVRSSGDPRVVPMLFASMKDPSPLVRASAVEALQSVATRNAVLALVRATQDEYRLVRVRAAASLAPFKDFPLAEADRKAVEAANKEYPRVDPFSAGPMGIPLQLGKLLPGPRRFHSGSCFV